MRTSTASSCSCRCPTHIDEDAVIEAIDPDKDVDGFHPDSVGRFVIGKETFLPCTPHGCMVLLEETGVDLKGKDVVVVGRSNIVGKPVGLLPLAKHATVTICHCRTDDLPGHRSVAPTWSSSRSGAPRWSRATGSSTAPSSSTSASTDGRQASSATSSSTSASEVRLGDHAGSRRRRPDDHRHAAGEHPRRPRREPPSLRLEVRQMATAPIEKPERARSARSPSARGRRRDRRRRDRAAVPRFDGELPHAPIIAMEVFDDVRDGWPAALTDALGDVIGDPAAWAKACVERFGADMICVQLAGTDPNGADRSPEEAAETVRSGRRRGRRPGRRLRLGQRREGRRGPQEGRRDGHRQRARRLGPATEENYKPITAAAWATATSSSPRRRST